MNYVLTLNIQYNFRIDVITELKEKLPPYIVEFFLVSGFDGVDAIIEMNTDDDGPKSSISSIENFILAKS